MTIVLNETEILAYLPDVDALLTLRGPLLGDHLENSATLDRGLVSPPLVNRTQLTSSES